MPDMDSSTRTRSLRPDSRRFTAGFTLIELLVVVAIIALLIAILLPSLSKARAQARTSVCASRISQLVKAILLYAEDNGETPPFMGRGWEDCDDEARLRSEIWPAGSGKTLMDWAYAEDWLMPNMPEYWMLHSDDWPDYATVRNGRLYQYTRFENLYRCPDFERVADPAKSQNVFNYTRMVMGRKWFHRYDPEGIEGSIYVTSPESNNWCGQAGPIMKLSQVYAPSLLRMFIDEYWRRHCAAPVDEFHGAIPGILGMFVHENWFAADCMFGHWGSEIGRYHGSPGTANIVPLPDPNAIPWVKKGSAAYYDGHVGLDTDPLPDRYIELPSLAWGMQVLHDWILGFFFAQRGQSKEQVGLNWGMMFP
ncbi:MAG: prepilin-type N-terminal cleavage/methylation domain-containing protein [Phycisphaerae bacterium]|nr:prepilin-type N-terminal cleavage/methylation domain-containing protein [Phycisphaerae bacterium]